MKSNPSRATITKAAPINTQPSNVELAGIQPGQPAAARPAPVKAAPTRRAPVKTRLEFVKPDAQSVFVAGSFNDWNPSRTPLSRSQDGKWIGELTGISGRHEYLFVVDGQWLPDPNARESVQNPFGGRNSVLVVSA